MVLTKVYVFEKFVITSIYSANCDTGRVFVRNFRRDRTFFLFVSYVLVDDNFVLQCSVAAELGSVAAGYGDCSGVSTWKRF